MLPNITYERYPDRKAKTEGDLGSFYLNERNSLRHFIIFGWMNSGKQNNNRRTFIRLAIKGVFALFGVLWYRLVQEENGSGRKMKRVFPFNKNKSVSFDDTIIIVNREKETVVFSAHCSHLGCLINKTENGRLICPCHGSEYDLDGKPVKGPAYKKLERLPAKISADGTQIELEG